MQRAQPRLALSVNPDPTMPRNALRMGSRFLALATLGAATRSLVRLEG
jgi:hypothetical protein